MLKKSDLNISKHILTDVTVLNLLLIMKKTLEAEKNLIGKK